MFEMVLLVGVLGLVLLSMAICRRFPRFAQLVGRAVADVEVDWTSENRGPLRW